MIKLINVNEKETVTTGEGNKKVLFKIKADRIQNVNEKRMPLNVSLVIDISGSMNESVGNKENNNSAMDFLNNIGGKRPQNNFFNNPWNDGGKTKLSQVKEAASQCIDLLEDGDFISIVTFNNAAYVVQETTKVSEKVRKLLKSKINGISAGGGTNLHEGWLKGGMEVAKNLSSKSINRILLLTDGETNQGITNTSEIAKHVEGLAQKGISTSTFGVGDHYSEDLLEKMATVSGGNSYYIEDENKVVSILMEEFSCLNNIVADNATLEFISTNGASISCLNELDYANKKFMIGNIIGGREVTVLMEYNFTNPNAVGYDFELGKMKLEFINKEGKKDYVEAKLTYKTVEESEFISEKINEEVNVQSAIFDIAKKQKLAKDAFKVGDREYGMDLLRGSIASAQMYAADARVMGEINQMNSLMHETDYSDVKMSKMLSSMSYSTRTSRK